MKILVVGNGGREHALLWKLRRDAPGARFFSTRPNPGMAPLSEPVDLAPDDVDGLAGWAEGEGITLTVVGPEVPLALGIADVFRARSLPLFGPTSAAARLESSKKFAKELMDQAGVPTAAHRTFDAWPEAEAYIRESGAPVVVKASGLAAGKGAVVCDAVEEALEAARGMLEEDRFGEAGAEVVVEEFMEGEELSVFALTDGRRALILVPSQDHKRIGAGDTGPNTGGMGAYAPVPVATAELVTRVRETVFLPVLDAMEAGGSRYRGLLYAGLMLTETGPRVVEFNCRFGDPEAQVVVPLMDGPLLEHLVAVARGGSLENAEIETGGGAALNTVLASEGYPGAYEKGREIRIPAHIEDGDDLLVFHAGTALDGDRLVTAGGRVLSVVGLGSDLATARDRSLEGANAIEFQGKSFRRDIGWRALEAGSAPGR